MTKLKKMKTPVKQEIAEKLIMMGTAALTDLISRKVVKKGWKKTQDEKAPKLLEQYSTKENLMRFVLMTFVTSIIAGALRALSYQLLAWANNDDFKHE